MMGKRRITTDTVVILSEDGTADIADVLDTDDRAVYAQSETRSYALPRADLRTYIGPAGRVYVLSAEPDYVRDTERLADLEQVLVLRQITSYAPAEEAGAGWRWRDIILYVLIFVLVLGLIVK